MHGELSFANAFAGCFDESSRTESRFEDENGVAAAGFGFDQLARGFAANFFVRGPEKNNLFLELDAGFLKSFEREKGLGNASFHIESAGAIGFTILDVKRHFGELAAGIDGVVVAEDKELRLRARRCSGATQHATDRHDASV